MYEEFIYCSPEYCSDIFTIDLAGKSYCDGTYSMTRQKSDVYVLEYVIKGTGTIMENDIEYTASENQLYLLKKGMPHRYFSSSEDPWIKIWMNIKGSLVDHLLEVYPLNEVVYPGEQSVLEHFQHFHAELQSGEKPQEVQKSCSMLLHQIIINLYYNNLSLKQSVYDDAFKVKRYLEQHVLDSVSLDELSHVFYKSKAQIIRQFKKAYGIPPYAYLLNIKLRYAKKLLAHTNIPIKEIAERLVFADEHYFSSYFKQAETISPSRYRLIHQKGK